MGMQKAPGARGREGGVQANCAGQLEVPVLGHAVVVGCCCFPSDVIAGAKTMPLYHALQLVMNHWSERHDVGTVAWRPGRWNQLLGHS